MSVPKKPKSPRTPDSIAESFRKLQGSATNLNSASDGLSAVVKDAEAAFKELNLGVSAFVAFGGDTDYELEEYWAQEIGYMRYGSKGWCIVIRTREGEFGRPDQERVQTWPFDEAPRAFRPDAVDMLPDLLDELAKEADKVSTRLAEKKAFVQQFVGIIKDSAANQAKVKKAQQQGAIDALKKL